MAEKKSILMVDDVKLNHAKAREVLEDTYTLYEAMSAAEAFDILEKITPDLILLDIIMPGMSGQDMVRILKKTPGYKNIPVIFLTADNSPEAEVDGFTLGIADYITKPFVAPVMKKRIETQIELAEYRNSLEEKVAEKVDELEKMYDVISLSFAGLVESRDGVTGGHLKNTGIYYKVFIQKLRELPQYKAQLSPIVVKKAIRSAPLHDVGKIAIKDAVLQSPNSLTTEEFEEMKDHSSIGGELFDYLKTQIPDKEFASIAADIARYHHEKWDGTGYPTGLKGENIPLIARIMSIVDVYDALTSERPYKEAFSHEKAMAMIVEGSGTAFDPALVEEFVKLEAAIRQCLGEKEKMNMEKSHFIHYNSSDTE